MNKKIVLCFAALLLIVATGCSKQQPARAPQSVAVKAMQVIQQDTPVTYEFVGEITAKDEVPIKAQVSGAIARKLIQGGDTVSIGQPLFEIDQRQYAALVSDAEANVAQARASLMNIQRDVERYRQLAEQGGIAQQSLDTAISQAEQTQAQVNAHQAKLDQARINLADTTIVSPVNGRIGVGELSAGTYATAGNTILATVSTVDPVQVHFSMSENEYLRFSKLGNTPNAWGQNLKLMLSDGSEYPLFGQLEQIDRALTNQTGTLAMKASFSNPQHLLVPGMFARIVAVGETRSNALLIPQRAVQEMLGKTFVTVVDAENKAVTRPIVLGPKINNLQIVESGLTAEDVVIVEGFMKAQPGASLAVTMIGLEDLNIPGAQ